MHDYVSKSEHKTSLSDEIFSCFERLCLTLRVLCTIADSTSNNRIKLLLCQCIGRASKIVRTIGCGCAVSHTIEMPSVRQIMHIATALQALASSLLIIRDLCGEESYAVSMLFWIACESWSCVVDLMPHCTHGEEEIVTYGKSAGTIIFDALRLTSPSPHDLHKEIHRLQHEPHRYLLQSGSLERTLENTLGRTLERTLGSTIESTIFNIDNNRISSTSIEGIRGSLPQTLPQTLPLPLSNSLPHSLPQKECCNPKLADSIRLQYLLDGLQMMLRAGILDDKKEKQR